MTEATQAAAASERAALTATAEREAKDAALPPLREEDAIAGAVLQRIEVEWTSLDAAEARARSDIDTLEGRLVQLARDISREETLSGDADASIEELKTEADRLEAESAGHDGALAAAEACAEEAAAALGSLEALLSEKTEEAARVAARHQSVDRRVEDARKTAERGLAEAEKAGHAAQEAEMRLAELGRQHSDAQDALATATDLSERTEAALTEVESERAQAQGAENDARAKRSDADGQLGTLDAEIRALSKLLDRERAGGQQLLDQVQVAPGFEAAVGAALADDLKAPLNPGPGHSGWRGSPGLPRAATATIWRRGSGRSCQRPRRAGSAVESGWRRVTRRWRPAAGRAVAGAAAGQPGRGPMALGRV